MFMLGIILGIFLFYLSTTNTVFVLYFSFDEGIGPIQFTNVLCRPTDDLIIQCPIGPTVRCSHAQDLVIQCCK